MKKKKGFSSRLLRKYRLTIHNENKLENVLGFYISPLWVILSLFFSFMLVVGVLYLVILFTPVGSMLPGYVNKGEKDKIISNNLRVDSLMHEIEKQDAYLANIRAIMSGDITIDSLKNSPQPVSNKDFSTETTRLEAEFVKNWEERERYNLTSQAASVAALQELNLFRPTNGEIIKAFDPSSDHYGIDIAEVAGENIVAIHDGIVVFSDYTANDGYTIALQHRENLISIYRNCYRLLKQVGDKVYGGEVIGTLSDGSGEENGKERKFLHLELWHRSKPLDPDIYISF
ncbi:MAG: M23 family metallopeptidase [Bacteroidaceae bacterium]|nr:M23 family metallopeptidase [Bacteroidaceae bacterium]